MSSEIERSRILTFDEELRLLASCQGGRQITYTRKGKEIRATISVKNISKSNEAKTLINLVG